MVYFKLAGLGLGLGFLDSTATTVLALLGDTRYKTHVSRHRHLLLLFCSHGSNYRPILLQRIRLAVADDRIQDYLKVLERNHFFAVITFSVCILDSYLHR